MGKFVTGVAMVVFFAYALAFLLLVGGALFGADVSEYGTLFIGWTLYEFGYILGIGTLEEWEERMKTGGGTQTVTADKVAQLETTIDWYKDANRGWQIKWEQLEAENEELRDKAQRVVDGVRGRRWDNFSGLDDCVVPSKLIDELQDALLTPEDTPISDIPVSP